MVRNMESKSKYGWVMKHSVLDSQQNLVVFGEATKQSSFPPISLNSSILHVGLIFDSSALLELTCIR